MWNYLSVGSTQATGTIIALGDHGGAVDTSQCTTVLSETNQFTSQSTSLVPDVLPASSNTETNQFTSQYVPSASSNTETSQFTSQSTSLVPDNVPSASSNKAITGDAVSDSGE